jgi:hypothetical protein
MIHRTLLESLARSGRPAAISHPLPRLRRPATTAAAPGRWLDRAVPATLSLVVVLAGVLRGYGLAWGAPYFHFHIDEHFVFVGAERLRVSMAAAAQSAKFFMYGPVPVRLLNAVVWP